MYRETDSTNYPLAGIYRGMARISRTAIIGSVLIAVEAVPRLLGGLGDVDTFCLVFGIPAKRCGSGTVLSAMLTGGAWEPILILAGLFLILSGERKRSDKIINDALDQKADADNLNSTDQKVTTAHDYINNLRQSVAEIATLKATLKNWQLIPYLRDVERQLAAEIESYQDKPIPPHPVLLIEAGRPHLSYLKSAIARNVSSGWVAETEKSLAAALDKIRGDVTYITRSGDDLLRFADDSSKRVWHLRKTESEHFFQKVKAYREHLEAKITLR